LVDAGLHATIEEGAKVIPWPDRAEGEVGQMTDYTAVLLADADASKRNYQIQMS
jgi:hypothetical protein